MLRSNRSNKQNEEEFGEVNIGYTEENPPNYEDALNHNNVKDDPKKSDDMIESLDMDDKEKKDGEKKSDKGPSESWLSKATKLSTYDPRNSYMWRETDGDKMHILVLFFLYILQGIPLGLRTSVPLVLQEDGSFLPEYYVLMIFISAVHRAVLYGMFVAIMAFFARISDPVVGGTNMTFFNTLANLGNMWPDTFFLWFVDVITYKDCNPASSDTSVANPIVSVSNSSAIFEENFCIDDIESKACKAGGGSCDTTTDGYYILCLASAAFGFIWLIWAWRTIKRLQEIDIMEWRVTRAKTVSCYGLTDIVVKKITGLKG